MSAGLGFSRLASVVVRLVEVFSLIMESLILGVYMAPCLCKRRRMIFNMVEWLNKQRASSMEDDLGCL